MAKISYLRQLQTLLIAVAIGALSLTSAICADDSFSPVYNPTMKTMPASSKISIDGKLDDAGWKNVEKISQFVERDPGDQIKPEVRTEAFITYDDNYIYVGFICYDDPGQIRATMCQRDRFFDDDEVAVSLDTYSDASRAYMFHVNPYGVQKDGLWTSISTFGVNYGIDFIWKSAAQRTERGYQVEIAIPFASIRFPDKEEQSWKVDLRRKRPRESSYFYGWAALDRNEQCWPCQWSTVTGVKNVKPGKGIEILPTYIAYQSGSFVQATDNFDNHDVKGEPSIMSKYSISSDITFEGTLNPDFSQIEADAARIDVNSTFALFFPERRPFFQEGSDIFQTLFNAYYTRAIQDPKYAVKFTGRKNRMSFGFVSALDENTPYIIPLEDGSINLNAGESYVNVFRAAQSFGQDSRLGFLLTDRRFKKDGYGTTVALDGDIRLSQNYSIDGQFVYSFTGESDDTAFFMNTTTFDHGKHNVGFDGESYQGYAFISRFLRRGRHFNFVLDHDVVGPAYRTETGFDPVNNHRTIMAISSYTFYPEKSIFQRITPRLNNFNRWNWDGAKKFQNINIGVNSRLRFAQTSIDIVYHHGLEQYAGTEFRDLGSADLNISLRPSDQFGLFFGLHYGEQIAYSHIERGNQFGANIFVSLKPISRITIEPSFNFSENMKKNNGGEFFRQIVTRTRLQLQANRELSLRLVVQYVDTRVPDFEYIRKSWSIDPLITYRLSSFSVFYIGSSNNYQQFTSVDVNSVNPKTDWKLNNRQFFMKLQYLFQT
ncbi:MAG: carbohydrate binding family 9 domain-containing protein [candidate division Zixibacteria bacterium]|nr:carbohydrate binding family 9 domain-containing protein [candidate division Zixibacteria bacterium]